MNGHLETTTATTAPRSDWAAVLPAACAVHCTLTPFAASLLPVAAISVRAEAVLLGVAVLLASASLGLTWRSHGRIAVLLLASLGAALWGLSLLGFFAPLPDALTHPIGGLVLAGALLWNGRLRHEASCGQCGCTMHG